MEQQTVGQMLQEEQISLCPDCGSEDLDFLDNERVCKHCGLVIE